MTRLIDADSLLDAVEWANTNPLLDHGEYAVKLIKTALTVDAVPVKHGYWMPTSERMPKRDEMVLVCFRWSGPEQFDIGYIDKDPDNLQLRWNFEDFDLYGDEMDDVVAWMPLPEPYKMDEVME